VTGFSSQVRAVVIERAQGYCERCGEKRGSEAHHRRARGAGGTRRPETNRPSNALWLCGGCHRFVESNRSYAYEQGWLVRQHDEPRDVPVSYRNTTVYLDDLGNMHDAKPRPSEAAS
jgi:5-methylcytosine-specific restriction protein A